MVTRPNVTETSNYLFHILCLEVLSVQRNEFEVAEATIFIAFSNHAGWPELRTYRLPGNERIKNRKS